MICPVFNQRPETVSAAGTGLALLSVLSMQGGQALAKTGFALAGPLPIASIRFAIGAAILLVVWRPRLPDHTTALPILGLGTALAGVNVFIYLAFDRLPLGLAVTLQFLGALAVSLIGARAQPLQIVWALLSLVGVAVIVAGPTPGVSSAGVVFALASAACWAAYILFSAVVGARTTGGSGLAWATTWAALLTVPLALFTHPAALTHPAVLATGTVVAVLSTVIANSAEFASLRRLPASVFAILVSLEPVVAALGGMLALDEHLTGWQWGAVVCVVIATIGATTFRNPRRRADESVQGSR